MFLTLKQQMKYIVPMIIAAGAFLPTAYSKTIYCPTCSQSDFENAYYVQSVPGDTIILPAGSATWGNSSRPNNGTIYLITSVTVQGQGDSTVITMDDTGKTYASGVIALWAPVTFKDMKFIGASVGHPVTVFDMEDYSNPATGLQMRGGFRLTNITYEGHSDGYFANIGAWVDNGVIDNCRISCDVSYAELIFMRGRTDAWQLPNTIGGPDNVFVEDCTFNDTGYVCDANANARLVVRYNTINGNSKVDGHGVATNTPPRSFRNMEVYGNHWTNNSQAWTAIEIRGGTSMVFNNISDNTYGAGGAWFMLTDYAYQGLYGNFGTYITNVSAGNPTTITTSGPHGLGNGWNVLVGCPYSTPTLNVASYATVTSPTTFTIPVNVTSGAQNSGMVLRYLTPFDYPIPDQVGVGMDPRVAASEPAYVWNNLKQGAAWTRNFWNVGQGAVPLYQAQTGNPNATFGESDVIQSNRDFFADAGFATNTGVSIGTTAQMSALKPSIVGYGFWVTDQGKWNSRTTGPDGQFYVWNGKSWTLKYTPYPYPHPARRPAAPAAQILNK